MILNIQNTEFGQWGNASAWVALLAIVLAPAAAGEAPDAQPPQAAAGADGPLAERDALGGELWRQRSALAERGISVAAENTFEWSGVLDGGVNQRDAYRNLFTLDVEADLETMVGVEGATVFAQFLSVNAERGGSADAGDIQVYSNIESDRSLSVLYELWYEQLLWDGRVRVKVGKVDANSEFAFVDAAGDFANSSAGFSPTVFVIPSYPDPAMSVNVFLTAWEGEDAALELGYGLYDGALAVDGVRTGSRGPSTFFSNDRSNDLVHFFQAALGWDALGGLPDGRISAGGWYHTGDFATFAGGTEDGTSGLFFTAEQRVLAPHGLDDERGLYLFGQYGWADEEVSEFAQHWAGGVVLRGVTNARPDDAAGVYITFADLSDDPAAGFVEDETAIDVYYRVQLTPAVYVQPELQYIINPSGDPAVDDALVGGVRVGATF